MIPTTAKRSWASWGSSWRISTGKTPGAAEFAGGIRADTGARLDEGAFSIPKRGSAIDYDSLLKKWAGVFTNTYHTFAHHNAAYSTAKLAGKWLLTVGTLGVSRFISKSKPDTKAMLMIAYQAQEAIRTAVEDNSSKPAVDAKVKSQIQLIKAILPDADRSRAWTGRSPAGSTTASSSAWTAWSTWAWGS